YVLLKNHQFEICLNQTRKIESSQGFRKNLKLLSIKTAAAIALGWTPEEINQELIISIKGTDYSNSDIYKKAKSLLLKHRCSKNNLFDSSSVKIDHYAQHVKTDTLFVTFGNALADIDKKPFAYDLILQQGWDLVSVMPRKDSMYQGLSFDQFKELISALLQKNPSYSKVFFYGSSLGAYAAVYYSGSCNAVSIAAGVRNSAHPLISHLTRFEARRQPFEHTVHLSNIPKTKNPVFIIYDPTLEMDRIMVEQWCMPAYPDAKILSIPHGGHPPLQMLQELGQLKSTIISIVETGNYGIKDIPYESSSIYWLNKANYEYRIQAFVDCKHSCLQGLSIQNPKSAAKLQYLLEKLDQKEDTSNLTLNIEPACMKT
ncbi:MAG: hypothetical protein VXY56_13435, partial [Pseudomonadota bacterium]|nr:hypothetical protein [Pseudomonadota bacterium]